MNHGSAQAVLAFAAITFGVIPLGQLVFAGRVGSVWGFLLGGSTSPPWLGPVLVVVAALVLIGLLERRRRMVE